VSCVPLTLQQLHGQQAIDAIAISIHSGIAAAFIWYIVEPPLLMVGHYFMVFCIPPLGGHNVLSFVGYVIAHVLLHFLRVEWALGQYLKYNNTIQFKTKGEGGGGGGMVRVWEQE
jgi:hypothetical protein